MSRRCVMGLAIALVGCGQRTQPASPAPPATISAPGSDTPATAPPVRPVRLPRLFLPTGYAARLAIDPADDGFSGSIAITGVIDKPTSVIWLHGRELEVKRAVATHDGTEIALTVTPRGEDTLELTAASPLPAGTSIVSIDYTAKLDVINTTGAFKQVVQGASYVYTQLEALYARRVFPCLDEPDNKVPWKLTLDVPSKLVAVSNAPVVAEKPLAGGNKRVEFAETKPLPTYLVAFGIGPFEIVEA
ncbi:MAG: M1 family peptidase, partial [Kofleriaceae bacterium]